MNSNQRTASDDEEIASAVVIEEPVAPPLMAAVGESATADSQTDHSKDLPGRWREIWAMILLVILCDLTIYRGHGFSGYAFLFATAPFLLVLFGFGLLAAVAMALTRQCP